ncbi:MAG: DUF481 domain-containing protein [Mariprofundales bacterium]
MLNIKSIVIVSFFFLGVSSLFPVMAEEVKGWNGDISLGGVYTGGNTQTKSINAAVNAKNKWDVWTLSGKASALNASDFGTTTVEKYDTAVEIQYDITERAYLFLLSDFEKERFSGYLHRTSETFGIGYHLIKGDVHNLYVATGVGARQSKLELTKITKQEVTGLASAGYFWTISPTSSFEQQLFVQSGKENTVSESSSKLTLQIYGNLAAQLAFNAKHTSKVPTTAQKKLDTESSVNLVYNF